MGSNRKLTSMITTLYALYGMILFLVKFFVLFYLIYLPFIWRIKITIIIMIMFALVIPDYVQEVKPSAASVCPSVCLTVASKIIQTFVNGFRRNILYR